MTPEVIETLGDELYHVMTTQTVVEPLTTRHPDITIEHTHHIQQRMISRRLQAATDFVMPCFEIVDSRIREWKIKIQDAVADNASCGMFVLGSTALDPRKIDLMTCGMVLEKNGEILSDALAAMFPAKASDHFLVIIGGVGGIGGCSVRFH